MSDSADFGRRRPERQGEVAAAGSCAPVGSATMAATFAELDKLSTEQLRERAFSLARHRRDLRFFWDLVQILPHAEAAEQLDGSPGVIGNTVEDAIDLWREFTGHDYGTREPIIRAAFIEYLTEHS